MYGAAVAMAQLNLIAKGYMKIASDSDRVESYRFTAEGELQHERLAYWADTAGSGRRRIRLRWRFGFADQLDPNFNFLAQARCTVCGRATRMMMGAVSNRYMCESCDDNPQAEGDWERLILKLKSSLPPEDQGSRSGAGVTRPLLGRTSQTLSLPAVRQLPTLDEASYQNILSVIENMSLVMERSPTSFIRMGEEDIRQHFLVQLNGQYKGDATGETFNFQGKTDILIRSGGHNVFIAECKFWNGEKVFLETVNQILSYLSWRDTKAAIIIFNKTKQLTSVLGKIREAVTKHPNKVGEMVVETETRLRCLFRHPTDEKREVILTVMVFAVPNPELKVRAAI
jgi:hypothetical protein